MVMTMAMARKPLLEPSEFIGLEQKKQLKEIHKALSKIPSGKLIATIVEKEGHVFVPCKENKPNLDRAKGYHDVRTHEEAIGRALSNYLTNMNSDIVRVETVRVEAKEHTGVTGFKIFAKKS